MTYFEFQAQAEDVEVRYSNKGEWELLAIALVLLGLEIVGAFY